MAADQRDRATRLVNRSLRHLGSLRGHPPAFDVHRLLLAARRAAGLDDFGEPSFRQGLDRLVAALDDEAELTPLGRRRWRHDLVALLARRLEVRDRTKRSVTDREPAEVCPVVVVGPHSRRVGARLAREASAEVVGGRVEGDTGLLAVSFASSSFARSASVNGYDDWLLDAEVDPAYGVHRLQLEQWAAGRPAAMRPVLTADDHLWNLDRVHQTYPSSTLVVVDSGVLDSSEAAIEELIERRARTSDRVDRRRVEQWWTDRARVGAARVTRHRELWSADRVIDVASPESG